MDGDCFYLFYRVFVCLFDSETYFSSFFLCSIMTVLSFFVNRGKLLRTLMHLVFGVHICVHMYAASRHFPVLIQGFLMLGKEGIMKEM